MNWKREVLEKLHQYPLMEIAARNLPEEINRLEHESLGLRSGIGSAISGKGGGSHYEERLINNLILRQEMQQSLDQILWWINGVQQAMAVLPSDERVILERMCLYPEDNAQQRLCAELGIEQSSLYRKRESALRKLTIAMYGRLES